jgi:hypothetical protein
MANLDSLNNIGERYSAFNPSEDKGIFGVIQNWGNQLIKQLQIELITKKSYKGKLGGYTSNSMATKQLYQSIQPQIKSAPNGYTASFLMMEYWANLENGQSPGNNTNAQSIYEWLQAKQDFRTKPNERKSLAHVIARKINREGTKAKPFISPSLKKVTTDELGRRVAQYIADTLKSP